MNTNPNEKARPAKTAKQSLIAVEWILENIGWCQNQYHRYSSGELSAACLAGALELVVSDSSTKIEAEYLLGEEIRISTEFLGVVRFNDASLTTKEDVLKVVKSAIKRA